jgi:AcrR family transcriptional regulator
LWGCKEKQQVFTLKHTLNEVVMRTCSGHLIFKLDAGLTPFYVLNTCLIGAYMAQHDTVSRILDTAEALFAEKGFAETSLRAITTKANVNLAAVNYHFGSKKSLIQAVFSRFLDPMTISLEKTLDKAQVDQQQEVLSVEDILVLVAKVMVAESHGDSKRLSMMMRLAGLAYTQGQGHLRKHLQNQYSHTFKRLMRITAGATPELLPLERFWRFHFMLGSLVFTMASLESLQAIVEHDFHTSNTEIDIINQLLPFLTGGIKAGVYPVDAKLSTSER